MSEAAHLLIVVLFPVAFVGVAWSMFAFYRADRKDAKVFGAIEAWGATIAELGGRVVFYILRAAFYLALLYGFIKLVKWAWYS